MYRLIPLSLLVAVAVTLLVGCDSAAGGDEYSDILGRWEALGDPFEPNVYIDISDEDIVAHYFDDEEGTDTPCFIRETFAVVERDGEAWTLRYDDGDTETLLFRRDGEALVAEDPAIEDGDIVVFERSTRTDFTPLCGF